MGGEVGKIWKQMEEEKQWLEYTVGKKNDFILKIKNNYVVYCLNI